MRFDNNTQTKPPANEVVAVTEDGIVVEILTDHDRAKMHAIRLFGKGEYDVKDYPQRHFSGQKTVKFC